MYLFIYVFFEIVFLCVAALDVLEPALVDQVDLD